MSDVSSMAPKVLANNVIDYPRKDVLYRTSTMRAWRTASWERLPLLGLDDLSIDRSDISAKSGRAFRPDHQQQRMANILPVTSRAGGGRWEDHDRFVPRYVGKVALYFRENSSPRAQAYSPSRFRCRIFCMTGASCRERSDITRISADKRDQGAAGEYVRAAIHLPELE